MHNHNCYLEKQNAVQYYFDVLFIWPHYVDVSEKQPTIQLAKVQVKAQKDQAET